MAGFLACEGMLLTKQLQLRHHAEASGLAIETRFQEAVLQLAASLHKLIRLHKAECSVCHDRLNLRAGTNAHAHASCTHRLMVHRCAHTRA